MGYWANKLDIFRNSFITKGGYKMVLEGLQTTLLIAFIALLIGILIGTIIAIVAVSKKNNIGFSIWNGINQVYLSLFRGTPIVVQLLLIYYVTFPLIGIKMPAFWVASITMGLNSGAYVAEIMRSGILSVDHGQMEAGRSSGMSYSRTMVSIVLPQSIKNALPTIGNELIVLVKETCVVSFIAVMDLTKAFQSMAESNYEYVIPYIMLALIYLVIVLIFTFCIKLMERRLRRSEKRN